MEVISIVYSSSASEPFDLSALRALEERAQQFNSGAGITGYLVYRNGRFTQVLEGSSGDVAELLERIRNDARHEVTTVVELPPGQARRFPSWSMRLLDPLWLPSRNSFDAIDELLNISTATDDPDEVSEPLAKLVAKVGELSRYL